MKTNRSSKSDCYLDSARRYVDEQIATMKKHGAVKDLSPKQIESLVRKVASATAK
jgi:hypothetical protein